MDGMDFLMMGELKRKEGTLRRTWTPRWVVVTKQGELILFNNNSRSEKMLTIPLSEDSRVLPAENPENCFTVESPKHSKLELLANTTADMQGWINALIMGSMIGTEPQASNQMHYDSSNQHTNKNAVYSVKGMFCDDHAEQVRAIIKEISGIEKFDLDLESEYLHIYGMYDVLIIKDSIEKIGFLVYDEPDIPSKFSDLI